MKKITQTAEYQRLQETDSPIPRWRKWGTYVSERAWGTVREDYSASGDAWRYFPHDHARSRAYRWNEDGIAGFCDRYQVLLFSLAFWNGKDAILKERLYGLNAWEGNHGEDVKEYYYYLDATPTFSYMKYLYKYPHEEFPYAKLYHENVKRTAKDTEYELIDTGIFNQNNYFDVFVEYAKKDPDDMCIRIEIANRSDKDAPFHLIPQLWFRNQWAWGEVPDPQPVITSEENTSFFCLVADDAKMSNPKKLAFDYHLGKRYLYGPKGGEVLFTNNETSKNELWGVPNDTPYVKDAFHRKIINGENSVNPDKKGTKACLHYYWEKIPAKSSRFIRLRFTNKPLKNPGDDIDSVIDKRKKEADEFYGVVSPKETSEEEKKIQRQGFAGLIWNQQYYHFDVNVWMEGDNPKTEPPHGHKTVRNIHWHHLNSMRVFCMPDKWEYPWFAAWDLSFHAVSLALIDMNVAKDQLWLLLFDQFLHPNGQIPAYEWEFSDVNPPVQAWACLKIFEIEKNVYQREDYDFLERCFHRLLLNFAWWVNRIDVSGKNIFEGGFLGLDNISILDRSEKNKNGAQLDETDGAGWMAMFCLNLMKIALLLSKRNRNYELLATKFFEHFVYIAGAFRKGHWRDYEMWDETDGFFYSFIKYPDGSREQFRIRSLVGIIPFFAFDILDEKEISQFPEFYKNFQWFLKYREIATIKCIHPLSKDQSKKYVLSLMDPHEMERFMHYLWDPTEFRSDYGLRSLSKYHENHPFSFKGKSVQYEPGESLTYIKGGNSNWRGPIWLPANYLLIETLKKAGIAFDDTFRIKIGTEKEINPSGMAKGFAERLFRLFLPNENGFRPIYNSYEKMQRDPHFNSHILFYEHYHGDNGRGLGASHQTGWSSLIVNLLHEFR